jgi:hypothetical protein
MLRNELRPDIHTKQRGRLSEGVFLLHGNVRPHNTAHTRQTLRELKFKVLYHPAYSPFGPPTGALGGRRFADDDGGEGSIF